MIGDDVTGALKTGATVVLALVSILLVGCAGNEELSSPGAVVGRIAVIGNVPFTRLAVQTDTGSSFLLICGRSLEDSLRARQGQLVKVRFSARQAGPGGIALTVVQADVMATSQQQ